MAKLPPVISWRSTDAAVFLDCIPAVVKELASELLGATWCNCVFIMCCDRSMREGSGVSSQLWERLLSLNNLEAYLVLWESLLSCHVRICYLMHSFHRLSAAPLQV